MTARKPLARQLVMGAHLKDPARYRGRASPAGRRPLGEPYATMTPAQKAIWRDLAQNLPWLAMSHRQIVRLACQVGAKVEASADPGVNLVSTYSAILSKLGGSPVDESRVAHGGEEDEDPADRFFQ